MRPSELQGKQVVETQARIIGAVTDVEIDVADWKVTNLRVELTDDAVEILGYKKPFLGHVEILISVDTVRAVADVVSLNKPMNELKDVIEPSK
jgi:sporulation protein YlmC with PRC-barrel domain